MVLMSGKPPFTASCGPFDKIRKYIEAHLDRAVPLRELGRLVGLSPFTVQRLFKRAMGATPLEYRRALRAGSLRKALRQGGTVTDAIYEAGFGSSSRVYEGAGLGMTPGRFARGGRGEQIGFTTARSPFGWLVVGATGRGLCWLALATTKAEAEASLREEFPAAEVRHDPSLAGMVDAALAVVSGSANPSETLAPAQADSHPSRKNKDAARAGHPAKSCKRLAPPQVAISNATKLKRANSEQLAPPQVDLRGTAFQLRVWQALRAIPRGETRSYSQLARELGNAKATRAVARACAANRVALVVPCHRVVGASGALTGYRWGIERKRRLLEAESGKA